MAITVTSVDPAAYWPHGLRVCNITGTGFDISGCTVLFGAIEAINVKVYSVTRIECIIPETEYNGTYPHSVDITVQSIATPAEIGILEDGFDYVQPNLFSQTTYEISIIKDFIQLIERNTGVPFDWSPSHDYSILTSGEVKKAKIPSFFLNVFETEQDDTLRVYYQEENVNQGYFTSDDWLLEISAIARTKTQLINLRKHFIRVIDMADDITIEWQGKDYRIKRLWQRKPGRIVNADESSGIMQWTAIIRLAGIPNDSAAIVEDEYLVAEVDDLYEEKT